MTIDVDKLRDALIDYFGTAMQFNPQAVIELSEVESASPERLVEIALANGFDLSDFELRNGPFSAR